jgi:hypothetical protein
LSDLIEIEAPNIEEVEKRLKGLEKHAPEAISKALNRAIDSAKTVINKSANKKYLIAQKNFKKFETTYHAKKGNLSGSVVIESKRLNLYPKSGTPNEGFKVSPKQENHKNPPSFYQSQVSRECGLENIEKTNSTSKAFVAKLPIRGDGLYRRLKGKTSGGKDKLTHAKGPYAGTMVSGQDVKDTVEKKAIETLNTRLNHEIDRIIDRYK